MKRFKKILYVVADNDEKVEKNITNKVQELALLNDAQVTIVVIEEEPSFQAVSSLLSTYNKNAFDYAVQQRQQELGDMLSHKDWQSINTTSEVLTGTGFIAVIRKVLQDDHDLVVLGDYSGSGLNQLSMRLIRKCPCPVWVIHRNTSIQFKRILAAVDLETESNEGQALNRKVLELTHSLAQREGGEAHYLHAWQLDYETMLRSPRFNVQIEEIERMKNELRESRKKSFEQLFQSAHIQPVEDTIHLVEGETVTVIEKWLDKYHIDVIVMGTVGRTGISGLLIGNKAEKLLKDIECTVLAVKPEGFVTPVTLD